MKYTLKEIYNSVPKDFLEVPVYFADGSFLDRIVQVQCRQDDKGRKIVVLSDHSLVSEPGVKKEEFNGDEHESNKDR